MSGLDAVIPIRFGTLYIIVNAVLLLFALIFDRKKIGIATLINLFLLGYIADFKRCGEIWDIERHSDLAERFYADILAGIRAIYIYKTDEDFIGEISAVTETGDPDYTIPEKRLYVSHLIVKENYRRQGVGMELVNFITSKAKDDGYTELSIGVDLDNYLALKLYAEAGFDRIISVCDDEYGRFVKLLKMF